MGRYITFIVGRKGDGKSLYEATYGLQLIKGYYAREKRYPQLKRRIYMSKQKFSPLIEKKELVSDENPNGHLYYWTHVDQLSTCPRKNCWKDDKAHHLHNADIAWDEIGNDLPPDHWKDTPDWLRQVFSHCRKRGNRIFANAQQYDMVDIHFRRQVDVALVVKKIIGTRDIDATRPDPKFVFVLQKINEFDPIQMEHEDDPRRLETNVWPSLRYYTKRDTEIFDTSFELPPYQVTRMREIVMECIEGDKCRDKKNHTKVRHVPL